MRVLYFKNLEKEILNFVDDILNSDGNLMSGEEIFKMLNKRQTSYSLYIKLY